MEEEVIKVEANSMKESWVSKQEEEDTEEKASTGGGGGVSSTRSLLSTSVCLHSKILKTSLILLNIYLKCQEIKN